MSDDFGPVGPYQEPVVTAEEAHASRLATARRQRYEALMAGDDVSDAFVGVRRPTWRDFARCRGTDPAVFFPERGATTQPARTLCAECPVQQPCLDHALDQATNADVGIWGGTSARERRQIRRHRQEPPVPDLPPDPFIPDDETAARADAFVTALAEGVSAYLQLHGVNETIALHQSGRLVFQWDQHGLYGIVPADGPGDPAADRNITEGDDQ